MPSEIVALIDKPWLLLLVLLAGAVPGMLVERFVEKQDRERRREWWRRKRASQDKVVPFRKQKVAVPLKGTVEPTGLDAAEQLRCVMEADFSERPLLNRPESAVFKALDNAVIGRNSAWQVMAQVSLGEFLASDDKDAYFAINAKRVDFALMDETCRVRHAIEYQGSGHHQTGNAAAARDAVKKEALRKAGIGYHEVVAGHTTPAELRRLVEKLVPRGG
jgi:hypothetical protein